MIPQKDEYVRVIFRNSTQAEGIVQSWSEHEAILRSLDGASLLIIQDTSSDIMAVKVYLAAPDTSTPDVLDKEIEHKEEIDSDFEEVKQEVGVDEYLRAKTLLELRRLQLEQDRKIISERLKDHTPSGNQMKVQYELPRFFKKQSFK